MFEMRLSLVTVAAVLGAAPAAGAAPFGEVPFRAVGGTASCMRVTRGKTSGTQVVSLPEGYLDHLDDDVPPPPEAEDADSGG